MWDKLNCSEIKLFSQDKITRFFGTYDNFHDKLLKTRLTCCYVVALKEPGGCGVRPAGRGPGAQTGQCPLSVKSVILCHWLVIAFCCNYKVVVLFILKLPPLSVVSFTVKLYPTTPTPQKQNSCT